MTVGMMAIWLSAQLFVPLTLGAQIANEPPSSVANLEGIFPYFPPIDEVAVAMQPPFASSVTEAPADVHFVNQPSMPTAYDHPPDEFSFEPIYVSEPISELSIESSSPMVVAPPERIAGLERTIRLDGSRWQRLRNRVGRRQGSDWGLGHERVMFAPLVVDTAISSPHIGFRLRADRGLSAADRLEYFWARAGRGPAAESRVNVVDSIFRTEIGNESAVAISEFRMRSLDPVVNPNTVGFGDMTLGAKALLYSGTCTKISTIFLSHLKTGPVDRGLGTGHVSLEPGLLLRYQSSQQTFLHSEIKYWLPIGGSSDFAGDVLKTGTALSTIWRETDVASLMPTFEVQTHSFLFGGSTRRDGTFQRINGVTAVDFYPGARFAFGKSSRGLWELGVAGGVTCADQDWFDTRLVLDLRWVR